MTRIVILGGPKTGKTTLAKQIHAEALVSWGKPIVDLEGPICLHTDDVMHLGWSQASEAASRWFDTSDPWIIEGVAAVRALRKWRDQHPGEPPPVDRVIYLSRAHVKLTDGQRSMAKGVETVWQEIADWLLSEGVAMDDTALDAVAV